MRTREPAVYSAPIRAWQNCLEPNMTSIGLATLKLPRLRVKEQLLQVGLPLQSFSVVALNEKDNCLPVLISQSLMWFPFCKKASWESVWTYKIVIYKLLCQMLQTVTLRSCGVSLQNSECVNLQPRTAMLKLYLPSSHMHRPKHTIFILTYLSYRHVQRPQNYLLFKRSWLGLQLLQVGSQSYA